jgi:nickel transport protein
MLKKSLVKGLVSLSFLSCFTQSPLLAHVIWFDTNNGQQELVFGHPELGREPLTVSKFQWARAYDSGQNLVPSNSIIQGEQIFVEPQGNFAALTAFYDNGFWRQLSDGSYENRTREEAESIGLENFTNYVKYTKAIYRWSNAISQPFGLPLEIVPLQNPLALQAGETLPIQVFLNGGLITNPLVEYLGETISVNSEGIALIPIGVGGLQVIEASYDDSNAVSPGISYATTLTAEAIPEPSLLGAIGVVGLMLLSKKHLPK